jgi:MtfA peptidase
LAILIAIAAFFSLLVVSAMREQRWFKKILFYYFPRYLRPLSQQHKLINIYCKHLTPLERKRFEWRAFYFLNTTDIEFRGFTGPGLINQNSVRYLIASVATQMSLFLSEDCFDAFNKIIIYPEAYFSHITKQYHKGETNPGAGVIVLSYPSFKKGFESSTDGVNLLMHELAHALWLENNIFDYEIFDTVSFRHYQQVAAAELERLLQHEEHFLRKYAGTNPEEFFAVAVENFFERPAELLQALPELYAALKQLLNQDTLKLQS